MAIEIQPGGFLRDNGFQHVVFDLDGEPWGCGNVPADLTGDDLQAHLEGREDEFWCDMRRNEHPGLEVVQAEGETMREAWERVLAEQ